MEAQTTKTPQRPGQQSADGDRSVPELARQLSDHTTELVRKEIELAIFRLVRGFFDHGSRRGFARLTGSRPGEQAPEPE